MPMVSLFEPDKRMVMMMIMMEAQTRSCNLKKKKLRMPKKQNRKNYGLLSKRKLHTNQFLSQYHQQW